MIRRAQPLLGTIVEITVPSAHSDKIDHAFNAIRDVHRLMSFHKASSDVSRINQLSAGIRMECDPRTIEVLNVALSLNESSHGHFDICIGTQLVKFGYLPNQNASRSRHTGRTSDIVVESSKSLRLKQPVCIDLGGIAKGYAVDCAVETLKRCGVPAAMVNAGGDLRHYGARPWTVTLQRLDGSPGPSTDYPACAIASSANERTRKRQWLRQVSPHIGRQGQPLLTLQTVTALANRCIIADAMTKVAIADPALANSLLSDHDGFLLNVPRIAA